MSLTLDSSVDFCAPSVSHHVGDVDHGGGTVASDTSTNMSAFSPSFRAADEDAGAVIAPPQLLGKGKYGEVYAATDKTGMPLAVKISSAKVIRTSQDVTAFKREFDTMRIVAPHTNIVQAYSYGVGGDGQEFIMMELMSNGSLHTVMEALEATNEVFSEDEIRHALREVLTGLEHLHRRGVVHGDIKPANILLGDGGAVKISDFGFSGPEGPVPQEMGTPFFMSSEAFERQRLSANDMWAVACCVGYLATGYFPWAWLTTRHETEVPLEVFCHALDTGKQPFEPTDFEHLTEPLQCLLERLFVRDASQRPTATELLADPFFSTINDDDACGDFSATGRMPTSFPALDNGAEIEESTHDHVRYTHVSSSKSI